MATGARVGDVRDVHHRHDVVNPVPRRRPRGRGADAAHGNSRFGLGAERRVLLAALPVLIPGTIAYVYFHWLSARFFEHT